jgi:hypothetical protein
MPDSSPPSGPAPPADVTSAAADAGLNGYVGAEAVPQSGGPLLALVALAFFGVGVGTAATNRTVVGVSVGVGLVLLAGALGAVTLRTVGRPRRVAYCYEGGVVLWRMRHPASAYPWSALRVHEWVEHGSTQSRAYRVLRVGLRSDQNVPLIGFGGDPERMPERIAQADRIAAMVAARELPRATERLARGDAVVYGRFRLTRDALAVGGVTLPWSRVREIAPFDGHISVHVHGRKAPAARVSRKATPHLRTLLALADAQLATTAADQDET